MAVNQKKGSQLLGVLLPGMWGLYCSLPLQLEHSNSCCRSDSTALGSHRHLECSCYLEEHTPCFLESFEIKGALLGLHSNMLTSCMVPYQLSVMSLRTHL